MKSFFVFLLINCTVFAFSQEFSREIKLQEPPMHGAHIKTLQERLLECGFSEIGEADGYYGPLTENAIRNIQKFCGGDITGRVDRATWELIFSDYNLDILTNIPLVSKYNVNRMERVTEMRNAYTSRGGYVHKYYQSGQLKKVEMKFFARLYEEHYEVFYVNSEKYFILAEDHRYHLPENDEEMAGYKGIYDYLYSAENQARSFIRTNAYYMDMDKYGKSNEGIGWVESILHRIESSVPWPSERWETSRYTFYF